MVVFFSSMLLKMGVTETVAQLAAYTLACLVLLLAAIAVDLLARHPLLRLFGYAAERTKTTWDDTLLACRTPQRVARLLPGLVIYVGIPWVLPGMADAVASVRSAASIYMLLVGAFAVQAMFTAVLRIYEQYEISKNMHIKGVIQVLQVGIFLIAGIIIVSILVGKTPLYMLSGVGAMTAVLMLIFRDAILGFVGGIQLTANRMVAIGDWIEMPKYGADGDVIDVALTTVKVQNWDKTITTIPTYALITESFKNWRGMSDSGGRRIKRAISIDMSTIRFCTPDDLEAFSRIEYIKEYLEAKQQEIAAYNRGHDVDDTCRVNGRRLTNVGTFRAYVVAYLKNHPLINQGMTFLVRQLPPTEHGLPIEIYVFSSDQVWAHYEAIQADIFDHVLAVVPEFRLRVFQSPTGTDFQALRP